MPYLAITAPAAAPAVTLGAPLTEVGETLKTLRERLVNSLANRSDLNPIVLTNWINDAYIDVATSLDLLETRFMTTFSLVASQPFYSIPGDIDYTTNALLQLPDAISYREGVALDKIDLDTYRRLPDLSTTGLNARLEPSSYFIYQNTLIVYPTPWTARTLVLDGTFIPQKLVKDTDSPVLTREWHRAILLKAREMVLMDSNSPQEALLAANNYTRYVQSRSNRRALEKTNRLATVSMPARQQRRFGEDGFPFSRYPVTGDDSGELR